MPAQDLEFMHASGFTVSVTTFEFEEQIEYEYVKNFRQISKELQINLLVRHAEM